MTLSDEDATRANFYGLLAHLFYASPDRALLEALADDGLLDTDGSALADAWQALVEAAAVTDCDTERAAYDKAFVDTDRARVTLYTRAYLPRYANEALLGALRADLAALGLSRREASREPEDHIAALCEAMRHLIATQKPRARAADAIFQPLDRPCRRTAVRCHFAAALQCFLRTRRPVCQGVLRTRAIGLRNVRRGNATGQTCIQCAAQKYC